MQVRVMIFSYFSSFLSGLFLHIAMHSGCKKDECALTEFAVPFVRCDEIVGAIANVQLT
jgi:hypothetical protein